MTYKIEIIQNSIVISDESTTLLDIPTSSCYFSLDALEDSDQILLYALNEDSVIQDQIDTLPTMLVSDTTNSGDIVFTDDSFLHFGRTYLGFKSENGNFNTAQQTHYLPPLQNTTELAALEQLSLADKARVYVEDENADYFYNATAVGGDVAPDDQTGSIGFWTKLNVGAGGNHAATHTNGTDDIQSATNAQKGLATAAHITAIEANTTKNTYPSGDASKVGNLPADQNTINSDIESRTAANDSKVGYTDGAVDSRLTVKGIEDNATADQSDTEIETAYNNQVSIVSQAEAETGTATIARRWTAQRVAQAITALAAGGLSTADIDTLGELNAILNDATLIDTNDPRLSDVREPTNHASEHTDGTDDIQSASNTQKGVATAAHITAIEANTAKIGVTTEEANPSVVSQAEAEAGIATTERTWTAERVKQAIVALGVSGSVDDTAYAVSWNGVTATAPSKNALYDFIETQVFKVDATSNIIPVFWGGTQAQYDVDFPSGHPSNYFVVITDAATPSIEGTDIASTGEAGGNKFLREDGDGTCSWQTIAGGGDALVANPLSQFAATTKAQLNGVISDGTPLYVGDVTGVSTEISNVVEDTTPQLGGQLDTNGFSIGGDSQTATGDGTTTINWGLGNTFDFQFGAFNEVFTFTAPTNAGVFLLKLVQDSVGSRTVTFPATVRWSGGTAPTLTTTATTGTDIITFYFDGTNYFAVEVLNFS